MAQNKFKTKVLVVQLTNGPKGEAELTRITNFGLAQRCKVIAQKKGTRTAVWFSGLPWIVNQAITKLTAKSKRK